ncbi:hypothetical protein Zmor_024868 [Zophobas morio]|uniref:Uncharacterized protein n=1 Tax=Zophobas morio TaxID=2755281 RepID=A0AA38M341_9CUCU|nr:hypothetical protein Zmor_024868 [Zophobas morio]
MAHYPSSQNISSPSKPACRNTSNCEKSSRLGSSASRKYPKSQNPPPTLYPPSPHGPNTNRMPKFRSWAVRMFRAINKQKSFPAKIFPVFQSGSGRGRNARENFVFSVSRTIDCDRRVPVRELPDSKTQCIHRARRTREI